MLPRLGSSVGVVVCAVAREGRHARRASTAIANICPPENFFPGALEHTAATMRRAPLRRVRVHLPPPPRPPLAGCASCVPTRRYAHTHRHCLACCRIRDDQLRVGGTDVSDPSQQWSSFALQQPRNTCADAVPIAKASAISVAHPVAL